MGAGEGGGQAAERIAELLEENAELRGAITRVRNVLGERDSEDRELWGAVNERPRPRARALLTERTERLEGVFWAAENLLRAPSDEFDIHLEELAAQVAIFGSWHDRNWPPGPPDRGPD